MTFEIRKPVIRDAEQILDLLAADYGRLGLTLNDLEERTARFLNPDSPRENLVIDDGEIQAMMSVGNWKYGDAAPFTRGGLRLTRALGTIGYYDAAKGVFVMSARDYNVNSPLDQAFNKIVKPTQTYCIPMLAADVEGQALLERHEFTPGKHGMSQPFGEQVLWTNTMHKVR